jgi:hypothetical protein
MFDDLKKKKKKIIERSLTPEPTEEKDNPYEKDSSVYSEKQKEEDDLALKSKKFKSLMKLISK